MSNITFEKASKQHQKIIFYWLAEPHMQEHWDNSQAHKDDIINFINGRKEPSNYFYGTTRYWVGSIDKDPFCFILSDVMLATQTDLSDLHLKYLSENGHTITLDFGIGNTAYLGRGLAAATLQAFVEFYHTQVDIQADTFFIDPDENNPRAQHVYEKAGFKLVGDYVMNTEIAHGDTTFSGVFNGRKTNLMVKKII